MPSKETYIRHPRGPRSRFIAHCLLLISSATLALATTSSPSSDTLSKVAIDHLRKLSEDDIDLKQDTALSPYCGIERRQNIRKQLSHRSRSHFLKNDQFSLLEEKSSGRFAAVLIRATNPRAPLSARVHAVALLQTANQWKAAPLPGSFANTDYGYDEADEKTVFSLQQWMARESVNRESSARDKAKNDLLESIKQEAEAAKLKSLSPKQAVLNLLKQFRDKNTIGILAATGALSSRQTTPLETTMDIIAEGLALQDKDTPWQLFTHPSVLTRILEPGEKKYKGQITVGFWNPHSSKHAQVVYLKVSKHDGIMTVSFPSVLKNALLPKHLRGSDHWLDNRRLRDERLKNIAALVYEDNPALSFPEEDSQTIIDRFLTALDTGDFALAVKLLPTQGPFFGDKDKRETCLNMLSKQWHLLSKLNSNPKQLLEPFHDGPLSLQPLQFAKTNRPGEFEVVKLWFLKDPESGWHFIPEDLIDTCSEDDLSRHRKKIETLFERTEKDQQEKQSKALLSKVTVLTPPLSQAAPTQEQTQTSLSQFRNALRAKDHKTALLNSAIIQGTSHTQTLKTFNYAIRGAADHTTNDEVLGFISQGKWSALSLRTESKSSGEYDYPLYLIVNTAKGPKVLLDIDLRHATNKGRKLLNARNFEKLKHALPADSLADLKSIFSEHEKKAKEDIIASEPIKD